MSTLLNELNEQQKFIVQNSEGYRLVLSGPGSGKTRTLTYNIAYLIEQGLAKPYNILAITFTNKAANEMKERIDKLIGIKNKRDWWIGTFHGICVRILVRYGKEIGISSYFTIADEKEQKSVIKEIIENMSDVGDLEPEYVLSAISNLKNNLVKPSDLMQEKDQETLAKIYLEYQERLNKINALDFDDLIMRTIDLFRLVPEVRKKFQEQFKYILVDESQDLNLAQFEFAKILSDKHKNLCLIGDSDQGIYSWRGANISIIQSFANLKETKIMRLEQNYRCTKTIVEASNAVIKNNKNRLDKNLVTNNQQGEKIVLYIADNEYKEAEFVAEVIDYCCHVLRINDYKDFAILYRTNSQSRCIEDELSKHYIPYQIVGGLSFYERKEVKDILAYIKLLVNPYDVLSFQRIVNEPKRNIGKATLQKIVDFIYENDYSCIEALDKLDEIPRITKKAKEKLKEFQAVMQFYRSKMSTMRPNEIIKEIAVRTGYLDMLDEQGEKDRVLNVYELANIAKAWYDDEGMNIEEFIKQMSLITDSDTIKDNDNVVKLMTVHTAKGLEFPQVFLVGLEENIFPHFLSISSESEEQIEEERRLFYVSMTRAKEKLYLTCAEKRYQFGKAITNKPSRFLKEIPFKYLKKI